MQKISTRLVFVNGKHPWYQGLIILPCSRRLFFMQGKSKCSLAWLAVFGFNVWLGRGSKRREEEATETTRSAVVTDHSRPPC